MEYKVINVYNGWYQWGTGHERFNTENVLDPTGVEVLHNIEINSENKLAAGDRVYFSTLSSVPRYKFSDYCKKNKDIVRTVILDKANTYIIGKKISSRFSKESIANATLYTKVSKDVFMNKTGIHVPNSSHEYVYVQQYEKNPLKDKSGRNISEMFKDYPREELLRYYDHSTEKAQVKEYNILIDEIRKCKERGIKIVTDETVNNTINQGITIDEDVANALRDMFKSNQKDNVGLAMEMMANCNYKESEYQLMVLLHEFRSEINEHRNKNLVNFKGLMSYFKDFNWQADDMSFIKEFATALMKRGMLDRQRELLEKRAMVYIDSSIHYWKSIFDIDIAIKFKEKELPK